MEKTQFYYMKMVTKNVKLSYLIKKLEEIKISYDF